MRKQNLTWTSVDYMNPQSFMNKQNVPFKAQGQ